MGGKKTKKNLNTNMQQPVKIIHFQELDSFIHFMNGQEMGGSLHVLFLETQLLCKGFYCPNPSLIANCKRESNTITGKNFKTEKMPGSCRVMSVGIRVQILWQKAISVPALLLSAVTLQYLSPSLKSCSKKCSM